MTYNQHILIREIRRGLNTNTGLNREWLCSILLYVMLSDKLLLEVREIDLAASVTSKPFILELAPQIHVVEYILESVSLNFFICLLQVTHTFNAESEKELSLSVGDYVVVRKVLYLLLDTSLNFVTCFTCI